MTTELEPPSEYFEFAAKLAKAKAAKVLADLAKQEAVEAAHKLAAVELSAADERFAESYSKMLESFRRESRRRANLVWEPEAIDDLTLFDRAEAMAINAGRY